MQIDQKTSGTNQDNFTKTLVSSATGGYIGGYTCFPFEGIKKRLQTGELLSSDFFNLKNGKLLSFLHPKELLRGSTAFATCVTVASASSITFNSLIKKLPFYDANSTSWNISAAIGSGMLGAVVGSTPVENTILIQQKKTIAPIPAMKIMLSQGITRPWVGVRELMMREAGFAGVMLWAGPAANKAVLDKTNDKGLALIGELGAGAIGALLTHPADTLATYRQKLDGKISLLDGAKQLYKQNGISSFYRGAISRIGLFVGCATIIPRAANIVSYGMSSIDN